MNQTQKTQGSSGLHVAVGMITFVSFCIFAMGACSLFPLLIVDKVLKITGSNGFILDQIVFAEKITIWSCAFGALSFFCGIIYRSAENKLVEKMKKEEEENELSEM